MLTRFRPNTTSGLPGRKTPCTWWIFTSRTYLPTVRFASTSFTRTCPSLWTFRFLRVRVISLKSPVTTCSRMERVKLVGIPIITPPRGALATLFSPLATTSSVSRFCRASRRSSSAWSSASVGGGGSGGGPRSQVDDGAGGDGQEQGEEECDAPHGAAFVSRGRRVLAVRLPRARLRLQQDPQPLVDREHLAHRDLEGQRAGLRDHRALGQPADLDRLRDLHRDLERAGWRPGSGRAFARTRLWRASAAMSPIDDSSTVKCPSDTRARSLPPSKRNSSRPPPISSVAEAPAHVHAAGRGAEQERRPCCP